MWFCFHIFVILVVSFSVFSSTYAWIVPYNCCWAWIWRFNPHCECSVGLNIILVSWVSQLNYVSSVSSSFLNFFSPFHSSENINATAEPWLTIKSWDKAQFVWYRVLTKIILVFISIWLFLCYFMLRWNAVICPAWRYWAIAVMEYDCHLGVTFSALPLCCDRLRWAYWAGGHRVHKEHICPGVISVTHYSMTWFDNQLTVPSQSKTPRLEPVHDVRKGFPLLADMSGWKGKFVSEKNKYF